MTTDTPDLRDAVYRGFANQPQKEWTGIDGQPFDRRTAVSASEIGQCSRRIKYGKVQAAPPRTSLGELGSAERGNDVENWIIRQLVSYYRTQSDWLLRYPGAEQRTFFDGAQSGTPDGLLSHIPSSTHFVLDVKSIDPRTNTSRLPKKAHVWQVTQNAYLIRETVGLNVVGTILLYVDASDYSKLYQHFTEYSDDVAQMLKRRADTIMRASSPEKLPAEGIFATDWTADCTYCQFKALCSAYTAGVQLSDDDKFDKLLEAERAIASWNLTT